MADYLKEDYIQEEIDPKIFNPAQQVRKSNANVNIEDIEKLCHFMGCQTTCSVRVRDFKKSR